MKRLFYILGLLIVIIVGNTVIVIAQTDMKAPVPKKETKVTKIHGYEVRDDYFWMRSAKDEKGKVRPEVEKYLEEENAYTAAYMKPHEQFADNLYKEMLGRIKQTDLSVPYRMGDWWYYTKTQEGQQYPLFFRSKKQNGDDEQLLLDMNEQAKGLQYYSIGAFEVSDDGNLLAFSSDSTGYRQYTMQVKDLRTGKMLADKIERVTSSEWSNDGKYLFVVTEDQTTKRSDKLWRHTVGTNDNQLVYEEKDELFDLGVGRSRDKRMLFAAAYAKTMREFRYLPADQPTGDWKVLIPREKDHQYSADYDDGKFYITTNKGAKNFRVVTVSGNDASEKNWKEFVPANPKVKVDGVSFFKNHIVVDERENGLEHLRVIEKKSNKSTRIPAPEDSFTMNLAANPEYDLEKIRYGYNSMVTPSSTYEYDLTTGKTELLKQQEIPSGYDKTKYETKRIWIAARDGVKVPVTIVHLKGLKLDGSAPMLLYAYGSYGASIPPNFSTARLSLVDRGMIYALASIRGGGDLGEEWREAGRMMQKMNTFNDFIDVADYFVKNKYTAPDKLVIQGGSAGGLLVGAVSNMRPDLFKAVIAQVPFVDVMNTMLDATLPLTTSEYIEWGNPNEKAAYDYMVKYSPYDNVKAQAYPNMLVMTSLNDSQVPYWEGAKFAAKIREMNTGKNTILLKTNMGAGHGGASGRYDALKETAFVYAYALAQVGIVK